MFSSNLLSGKNFIVTGGSSGLGFAMTKCFLEHGASVAICGRTTEKLELAAKELGSLAARLATFQVDVRDYAAVGEMIRQAAEQLGPLDGLVNNAAGNFICASEDLTENGFKAVVDIVLHGAFNCTHQVGQYLISNKR
ncbi:MAG: SDR family NAD(P)-dependent oxidoreductase, partial [Bdellovibrionales bacterium]|nr:SDR family NAD(P)-dependent oxidoreductase [Bdellovibrionales bacterium]